MWKQGDSPPSHHDAHVCGIIIHLWALLLACWRASADAERGRRLHDICGACVQASAPRRLRSTATTSRRARASWRTASASRLPPLRRQTLVTVSSPAVMPATHGGCCLCLLACVHGCRDAWPVVHSRSWRLRCVLQMLLRSRMSAARRPTNSRSAATATSTATYPWVSQSHDTAAGQRCTLDAAFMSVCRASAGKPDHGHRLACWPARCALITQRASRRRVNFLPCSQSVQDRRGQILQRHLVLWLQVWTGHLLPA